MNNTHAYAQQKEAKRGDMDYSEMIIKIFS